jgi:hypothetical protein
MSSLMNAMRGRSVRLALLLAGVAVPLLGAARAVDPATSLHMLMTPERAATPADRARADSIASTLRAAIARYRDTTAAVADGFRMFAPQIREQKIYHFTNGWAGVQEAFRFDPRKPTSLLYRKDAHGTFVLVGAMYVAPKRFTPEQLDERVPTSVARWHKHVNWCVPPRGQGTRWLERANGAPVFGPESPIATKAACDAVGGNFLADPLGWMVHANVMTSSDPAVIWGDDHAGHDMHDGMQHGEHDGMMMGGDAGGR